jgi:hypothetical protein
LHILARHRHLEACVADRPCRNEQPRRPRHPSRSDCCATAIQSAAALPETCAQATQSPTSLPSLSNPFRANQGQSSSESALHLSSQSALLFGRNSSAFRRVATRRAPPSHAAAARQSSSDCGIARSAASRTAH